MEKGMSLSRRSFVRNGALGALAVAAAGTTTSLFATSIPTAQAESEEKLVWGHCAINCPGRCALKFHVVDDEVVWVDTQTNPDAAWDEPQARACLRGRTYRRWMNSPDRINYPMKRVGKRGEGKFEQISWDEAIDTIASELKRVIDTYGNEAVFIDYATGSSATTARTFNRLLNYCGGYLNFYNSYSTAQISCITPYVFGTKQAGGSSLETADDAALILMFGTSPTETRQGGLTTHYDYVRMREETKGKIIVIDPRHNDSLVGHSNEWLPINPGTDAALCSAIAHVLITENMIDQEFLDTYCVGYDENTMPDPVKGQNKSYKDYILGTGYDMIAKTPAWAAALTGIPEKKIIQLAREIGSTKPLYVNQGWGPQRRSNGELAAWSIMMLPILTGQIGLPGTSNGTREDRFALSLQSIPSGTNPVKTSIPCFLFTDAIDHGTEMTALKDGVKNADKLSSNIKYMINYAGNCMTNQHSDINKAHDILSDESKCEFILGIDIVLCDSMKYADILLPDLFRFEQISQVDTGGDVAYMVSGQPCTSVKFERKTGYEICELIAEKMGVKEQFTEGKTQEEWVKDLYEQSRQKDSELPTYDDAMQMGVYTRTRPAGKIAMEQYRMDPIGNPLDTPSGKIEIYSEKLATISETWELEDDDIISPIPVYAPEWYGVETRTKEHPLLCNGFHYRGRLHSSWGNVEILKELNPQECWINPIDAESRDIESGNSLRVFNDFGEIRLLAKVTQRVIPGTVAISQGAWHDADMDGDRIDHGGCINTLTTQRPSPLSKGNPQHTNICQVAKA